ncbi:MAG TPA: gephyrin-like molybdotransferase Glp [Thermoanaerobaculia bacterium]|nr:gephyrin-like molybdotransferase Glp [Thermoanaerobaculia bacterium]
MLQVEDAQARVMAEIAAGAIEEVALLDAQGRVLREEVIVDRDAPPADNSAMDGYAVRAEDVAQVPAALRVIADIPAGHPTSARLEPRTAMRIMTGASLPAGADAVVQVEWTDAGLAVVRIEKPVRVGQNVRRRGEDMRAGDVVLRAGHPIGPAELAMLANARRARVRVGRKPVVAILSTGDELVDVDEDVTPGKIVNTNSYLLAALVRDAGATPRLLGIVRDTREATIAALESALESDFVISSGGVSVGAFDFVKEALDAVGAETKFWQIAMKPGKPVVLSRAGDRVVFGLPGNPVSCFVSFHLFVAPALRKAMGQESALFPPTVHARLRAPLKSPGDRRVYFRVRLASADGMLEARPLASQGSGSLTSMLGANGLAVVSAGTKLVEEGETVPVVWIGAL